MKVVFLDRDGTIIKNVPYLNDPKKVEFLDYVFEGLKMLKEKGFEFFILTNQSGIARGLINICELEEIHRKIKKIFREKGIEIKEIMYCPHHPDDNCECRKPKTGMVRKLLEKYEIDLRNSYLIGDKDEDILLAKNIGVKSVSLSANVSVEPDFRASSFKEAVLWIIEDSSS